MRLLLLTLGELVGFTIAAWVAAAGHPDIAIILGCVTGAVCYCEGEAAGRQSAQEGNK